MTKEAVKAGFYETEYGKYPRLQILTIEDRFAGKKPNIPLVEPKRVKEGDGRAKREAIGAFLRPSPGRRAAINPSRRIRVAR